MTLLSRKKFTRLVAVLAAFAVVGGLWLATHPSRESAGAYPVPAGAVEAVAAERRGEANGSLSKNGATPVIEKTAASSSANIHGASAKSAGSVAADGTAQPDQSPAQASGAVPADALLDHLDQTEAFAEASLKIMGSVDAIRGEAERGRLTRALKRLEERQSMQVAARAARTGVPATRIREDGAPLKLMGFDGDRPIYAGADNVESAISIATAYVRQRPDFDSVFGESLNGAGLIAAIYEPTIIRQHNEFQLPDGTSRLIMMEAGTAVHTHAEHVAGTIGAEGKNPLVKGMAPATTIRGWIYETGSKITGYAQAYPSWPGPMVVTSSSYGSSYSADDHNGRYGADDRTRDNYGVLFPYTMMFSSLGNSGETTYVAGPFETITGYNKENKNHITMGNAYEIARNAAGVITSAVVINSSSSRGPSDDGRIEPFLTANGTNVLSSVGAGSDVAEKTGTSMASPAAAGSTLILQQYFSKRFPGHLMRNDTVKALLAHTADDAGHPGPDYTFGYGVMNTFEAAKVIKAYADHPASRRLAAANLSQGETHVYEMAWTGAGPLRATISWIDPVGPTITVDDDRTPALVNDLDLTIVAPSGTVHRAWTQPYVLNGFQKADRDVPAVRGDNTVDNTEVVMIDAPVEAGVYRIEVSHKGSLAGGLQSYTLVHSGFVPPVTALAPVASGWVDLNDNWYRIEGSGFLLGAQTALMRDGNVVVTGEHLQVTDSRIVCRFPFPPAGPCHLVVSNPDGQMSDTEVVVQPRGITLTSDESTWTYSQNFDTLSTDINNAQSWINDPPVDTTGGLLGWYAAYFNADGTQRSGTIQIRANNGNSYTWSGLRSYGANDSTERAFGTYILNETVPYGGTMRQGLRLINDSGRTLTGFTLRFTGEQWRYGAGGTRNAIDVSYAIFNAGEGTLSDSDGVYTQFTRFDAPRYTGGSAVTDGNAAAFRSEVSQEVAGLNWAPGQELWLCWTTLNHPNYDDGLAIDDLVFTANAVVPPTPFETFMAGFGLSGTNIQPDATPAIDGVSNLLKFALGGSPLVADPSVLPRGAVASGPEGTYFTLTFPLRNAMTWTSEGSTLTGQGVILTIEQSYDLVEWMPAPVIPANPELQGGSVQIPAGEITFQETGSDGSHPKVFYRLRARLE